MEPQVLEKSAVTVSQEIEQVVFTEYSNNEKLVPADTGVMVIRWLTVFFCLAFWYGVYAAIKFLTGS